MEKKINEFKGNDLPVSIIPLTSDYIHTYKPEGVQIVVKMRPLNKGEKRDIRKYSCLVSCSMAKYEDYTGDLQAQWDVVGNTIQSWELKSDGKDVEFSLDNWELLPDWLKMKVMTESKRISGLLDEDHRFLG